MGHNAMRNAFFILLSVGLLLALYPLIHDQSAFLKKNFRSYSWKDRFQGIAETRPDTLSPDSVQVLLSSEKKSLKPAYSGAQYLSFFFNSLLENEQQTRIAYYGDSSIEGDMITQTVRDSLQKRFGGSGVGFVPIATHLKGFRRSVYYNFSEDWKSLKINKPAPAGIHYGYLGAAFACIGAESALEDSLSVTVKDSIKVINDSIVITEPLVLPPKVPDHSGTYTVNYTASKTFPGTNSFPSARLFYSSPVDSFNQKGSVAVTIGEHTRAYELSSGNIVNEKRVSGYTSRRMQLAFDSICNQVIYGISFESAQGVILDNLAFRGNSGVWLTRIRSGVMNSFQQKLDVDLVVLQFGLNVLNPKMTDYEWYTADMRKVIRHIRKGFKDVSILVVGPADKSIKINGKMQTDPSIPLINNALRDAAEQEKTAFFSFYEAMGGKNSMVNWVQSNPRLANLDYTHFTFEGAEKAGDLLLEFLLNAFDNYLTEQGADASVPF